MNVNASAAWAKVFPTCVGVNHIHTAGDGDGHSLPHVRGGEPRVQLLQNIGKYVFPTCVGVNHLMEVPKLFPISLPHVRGGEPFDNEVSGRTRTSSPRAWG